MGPNRQSDATYAGGVVDDDATIGAQTRNSWAVEPHVMSFKKHEATSGVQLACKRSAVDNAC